MMHIKAIIFVLSVSAIILACSDKRLILTRCDVTKWDEIDTIERYAKKGIYLFQLFDNGAFGKFTLNYAVQKITSKGIPIAFKFQYNHKQQFIVSKTSIAFAKYFEKQNYGWFNVNDGKINDTLPLLRHLRDSLKFKYSHGYILHEDNGYFNLWKQGKLVQEFNYGNLINPSVMTNYDELEYKLYKLQGLTLLAFSDNPDDLFKQKQGVFFIPSPGYGVVKKFDKMAMFKIIDSVASLPEVPDAISMEE